MNQKEIIKNIETIYPFKVVFDLKSIDNNLYNEVSKAAKNKKTSVKNFVEDLGFKYSRKPIGAICAEDVKVLDNLFPDKNIKVLSEVDNKLYYKLLTHAKLMNMDIKKYLNFLGFNYLVQKEEITLEYLKSELDKLYKKKHIKKLSVNQPQLYNKIYKFAQKENVSITHLVESLGYTIDLEENYKNNRRKNKKVEEVLDNNKTYIEVDNSSDKENIKTEKNKKKRGRKPLNKNLEQEVIEKPKRKVGRPKKSEKNIETSL